MQERGTWNKGGGFTLLKRDSGRSRGKDSRQTKDEGRATSFSPCSGLFYYLQTSVQAQSGKFPFPESILTLLNIIFLAILFRGAL